MWNDNETVIDLLGYKVHAELIKEIITDTKLLPITIGIFGDWGSGKSSLLKMLRQRLTEGHENTIVLYFNGWLFESYDDAKAALIESIIEELTRNKKIKDKISDNVKKILSSIKWMRLSFIGFKNIIFPLIAESLTGGITLIPSIINKLTSFKENPEELTKLIKNNKVSTIFNDIVNKKENIIEKNTNLIREFRNNFEKLITNAEIDRLIVLIDDLDRCSPERIIDNLEAIKLFLNVNKTAFIIGADPRIVSNAIRIKYKELYKANNNSEENEKIANDYLEKLIQVPYYLPKLSDTEVETYITLLLCQKYLDETNFNRVLSEFYKFRKKNRYSSFGFGNIKKIDNLDIKSEMENETKSLARISEIITEGLKGNPRQIKRFLNQYLLRKKLASIANIETIRDDILAKLMILEYSFIDRFNELNEWQTTQKGFPKQIQELEEIAKKENINNEDLKSYKTWNHTSLLNWLKTEPFLTEIDLRDYFWISRDKLSDIVKGSSLISPFVREIFEKLKNFPSDNVLLKIINEEVNQLNQNEIDILFDLVFKNLIENSTDLKNYTICNYLVNQYPDKISLYIHTLNKIEDKQLSPAAIFGLIELSKDHKELIEFLESQSKKNTKFGRAIKKKLEE